MITIVLYITNQIIKTKIPIERMQLVDYYDADDFLSIEHNNTFAFNYRESTDGSGRLSKHALGCAIDINPQINPYVNSNGMEHTKMRANIGHGMYLCGATILQKRHI